MKQAKKSLILKGLCGVALAVACAVAIGRLPTAPTATGTNLPVGGTQAYQAKVIGISDGDSITVRANNETIKVRLAQIDAPERGQPWGQKSKQELARLVGGKTVIIVPHDTDRYGRTIADLMVNGVDVNQAMVTRGAAWAYIDYARDDTMAGLQSVAKSSRQGLWNLSEDQRVAPWEYRRQKRNDTGVAVGR